MAVGEEQQAINSLPKRAAFIFFPNGVSLPPEKDPQQAIDGALKELSDIQSVINEIHTRFHTLIIDGPSN